MNKTHAIALTLFALAASATAESPYATQVVASTGLSGNALYNDPNAVLGQPTTRFNDGTSARPDYHRAKLVEAPYNVGPSGEKLLTTLNLGQSLTVKFDHPVLDDPDNPYGLDFNVFGNSFFGATAFTSDATNLNTLAIGGGSFDEPLKISVSPDNVSWYTYDDGPYADALWPTNAYKWDRAGARWTDELMDFTKPMNPALTRADVAGKTAAAVLDLYDGAAGGVGFDLAPSGFSWIQYIRVTGISGYAGGEIDGFADVAPLIRPVPEPAPMAVLGLALFSIRRRRR